MTRRYLDQRLKLPILRVVDALDAHGSLLKASSALGIGQPAVSRSLKEAEAIIGLQLFERHSRGVRPTIAGVAVVRLARRVLAELRRADEELDSIAGPDSGVVALGALPVTAAGVLPGALIRLKREHPGIQVRVQQGRMEDLLPMLLARDIDMVVGRLYAPAIPDGFVREALWEEPISFLARPDHPVFSTAGEITAAALRSYELVLPTVSQRVGQEIEHMLFLLGMAQGMPMRSSSYGFIREMLLATDHISVMPRLMMAGDLLRGALRVIPLRIPAPPRSAGLVLPRDRRLSPAGAAFAESLRAHIAEIATRGLADMPNPDSSARKSDKTGRRRRS
ncbi:LysR family transcriptional regulator [Neoroseomonas lacus]|uniref:Transcriptional regulator n=1 Tax=Neoroseomonas lacus TaxID=287609 RepID=A0A917KW08_9PROT|nr:LysR substrate-binding domain-containing protein [Neoroseomonas lacus]GGJ30302.1 transcriptional regulator [Neoroseomonas lacus]